VFAFKFFPVLWLLATHTYILPRNSELYDASSM